MNSGFLNDAMLEKDIENLGIYIDEENSKLNDIYKELNETIENYNSTNTNYIKNNIRSLERNIRDIYSKRQEYIYILQRVIQKYNMVSEATKKKFEDEGGNL